MQIELIDDIKFTISRYLDTETGLYYRCVAWSIYINEQQYGDYILLNIEMNQLEAFEMTYQILSEQAMLTVMEITNGVD